MRTKFQRNSNICKSLRIFFFCIFRTLRSNFDSCDDDCTRDLPSGPYIKIFKAITQSFCSLGKSFLLVLDRSFSKLKKIHPYWLNSITWIIKKKSKLPLYHILCIYRHHTMINITVIRKKVNNLGQFIGKSSSLL